MEINEIIKEKRLALGYTQEQLAQLLNVSTPAVNKWERAITYPDITILPALARTLKTDLNTLLSFKSDLSDYEVAMFTNELATITDFHQAYLKAMDKISEYPTCDNLIINVAIILNHQLCLNEPDNSNDYRQKIDELFQRCLISENLAIKSQAQAILINKYIKQGELDMAKKLIDELPEQPQVDKEQKLINLYVAQEKYDDAARVQESKLLSSINQISNMLLTLMEIALKQDRYEDAKAIADVNKKMHGIFMLWQFSSYTAHFELYANCKDRQGCYETLKSMLEATNHIWNLNESPLYRHIKVKKYDHKVIQEIKNMLLTALKSDPDYQFLANEAQIQELLQNYK